jgi:hypothetical protein
MRTLTASVSANKAEVRRSFRAHYAKSSARPSTTDLAHLRAAFGREMTPGNELCMAGSVTFIPKAVHWDMSDETSTSGSCSVDGGSLFIAWLLHGR